MQLNIACIAGGILGTWNKVLVVELLIASGEVSPAETLFRGPRIPPATQAKLKRTMFHDTFQIS